VGSGCDADLLDGQQGSYYNNAANLSGTAPLAALATVAINANNTLSSTHDYVMIAGLVAGDNVIDSLAGPFDSSSTNSSHVLATYKTRYAGTLRIKWTHTGSGGHTTYSQIRINGSAYGTIYNTDPLSTINASQDIIFSEGDVMQFCGWTGDSSYPMEMTNIQICGPSSFSSLVSKSFGWS
jgi:hypothetical protein